MSVTLEICGFNIMFVVAEFGVSLLEGYHENEARQTEIKIKYLLSMCGIVPLQ